MDDFDLWVRQTFTPGEPQLILPGRHVRIGAVPNPVTMTAEQALRLAAWLREATGLPEHGPCGMRHHAHDCRCDGMGGDR